MKILIDYKVYQKMCAYIKHASGEISGLGKVEKIDNQTVKIVDIALFNQVCSGTSTDIQSESLEKFMIDMMEKKEDLGAWRCWWHSHANMLTFWSNTDTNTIESLDPEVKEDNFFVSIVGNKKNDLLCRIDVFDPIRATIDKVDHEVVFDGVDIDDECKKEVKEKVKEYVAKPAETVERLPLPMTAGEIAAQEEKKTLLEADNFFTAEELGITKHINYFVNTDGIFILGKDGYWHQKLGTLSNREKRRVQAEIDKETRYYEGLRKEYYLSHPNERDDREGWPMEEIVVEDNGIIKTFHGEDIDE
jgi:hypothetical protein